MSNGEESTRADVRGAFVARAAELGVTWHQPVIRGVVAIVLGGLAIVWPGLTIVVLASLVGIFAVVDGVLNLFDGIRENRHHGAEFQVAAGVISLLAGVVLLVWPAPTLFVLTLMVGLFTVAGAVIGVVGAFKARGAGISGWGWGLANAVLMLLFGLLLLIAPVAGIVFVTVAFGFYTIVFGSILINFGLQLRKSADDGPATQAGPSDAATPLPDDSAQL